MCDGLIECLVFYGKTRIIVGQQDFTNLVRACGPYELIDLQSSGTLEIEYIENMTGVLAIPKLGVLTYDTGNIGSSKLKYLQVARKLFDDLAGPSGRGASSRFNRFERLVKQSDYSKEMLDEARAEWLDNAFTTEAARVLLSKNVPDYNLSSFDGNLKSAKLFQDEVIDGLPSIRDAVNNGRRTIADVIRLVE